MNESSDVAGKHEDNNWNEKPRRDNAESESTHLPQPAEDILIKIVSATYGPCEGQRLLTGEMSNQPCTKIPYTRDVAPILRALLKMQETGSEVDQDDDPHSVRFRAISFGMGGMNRTSITVPSLHDGWNSMNIVFGDVCPGTSKKLYIHYLILHTKQFGQKMLPEAHHVTFVENEPVILRRRITFYQEDAKLLQATARVVAKKGFMPDATISGLENAIDDDEKTLLVAHQMGRSQSISDFAQMSAFQPPDAPTKVARLRSAAFEIVLPIVLAFLQVPERVQCRLVCRLWRNILSDIGVAAVIDSTDPTFQHTFTRTFLRGILAHSYSSLHSLRLCDFHELCPQDLHPSLPHLRKLRVLDISRCIKLKDETLLAVAQNVGGTLEVLYIKGLVHASDVGVIAICRACTKLKVLEVSHVPITDDSGVAMGRLTNLRALYMRDNYKMTDRSIDVITANCVKLNQLTLWGCVKLKHLSFGQPSNGLQPPVLRLPGSHPVPTTTDLHPFSSGSKLVSLNLWGCFKLGDDIALALGKMKNLRTLIVSECHKLTDQFVIGVTNDLPQLVHLHLRYCKRLTDSSVHAIASGLNLYSLELSFCTQLTSQSICALIESRYETLSELRLQECRQLEIVQDLDDADVDRGRQGRAAARGRDGQAILKSLRSPIGLRSASQSHLSMIDLRCCGGQQSIDVGYPANDPFVRGMAGLQFQQKTPGFFARPARWNSSMQALLQEQLRTHSAWAPRETSDLGF